MISYNICTVTRMAHKDGYRKPVQTTLEGFEENPRSEYRLRDSEWLLERNSNPETGSNVVALYSGLQDVVRNKHGFVFGKPFYSYLEPHEFELYYHESEKLAIFNVGKDPVEAFVKSMSDDEHSGFELERLTVDFRKLMPLIEVISGAWFAEIKKQFLKSAGFFAPHVDKSDEFKDAAQAGEIQQLHFEYPFGGRAYKVALTRSGGVLLFTRIGDPKLKKYDTKREVELVLDLYNRYLKD